MPRWAEIVVRCHFVEDEDAAFDYRAIGELLIGFSDKEVRQALTTAGPIPIVSGYDDAPAGIFELERLAQAAREVGLAGTPLGGIRTELGLTPDAAFEELAARAEQLVSTERARELLTSPDNDRPPESAAIHVRNSAEPSRSQRKDSLGHWRALSRGVLPEDVMVRAALAEKWLSEPRKPVGGGPDIAIRQSTSDWSILGWLLGDASQIRSLLETLHRTSPRSAESLVGEVMRRGKAEAWYFEAPNRFSGWIMNAFGRPIKRSNVRLALAVEKVADSLEIPVNKQYRIGDLPALE